MTPEDKKIWDEIAKTVKPLRKKKKEPARRHSPAEGEQKQTPVSLPTEENPPKGLPDLEYRPHFRPKITLGQDRLLTRKLRQGTYCIQATLDLHGHTQEEAYKSLQKFVAWAVHRQLKLILIITGKGSRKSSFSEIKQHDDMSTGVLRQKVPQWLENISEFPGILSVSLARPQDGGEGAMYVELRKGPKEKKPH
jgi:DNA-nicking Smr family endonuclease